MTTKLEAYLYVETIKENVLLKNTYDKLYTMEGYLIFNIIMYMYMCTQVRYVVQYMYYNKLYMSCITVHVYTRKLHVLCFTLILLFSSVISSRHSTVDRYLQGTNIFNLLVPCSNT